MANNIIQIKRAPSTAVPASLNPGELAYSNSVQVLYVGSTDGASVVPIGGFRAPGTTTANQAMVVNSSLGISQGIFGNVAIANSISVNGSVGTAGYVLFSGGATTNAYWAGAGGLGVNTAAQYTWTNTQSFANTITFTSPVVVQSTFSANGGVGTALQVLTSAGAGANAYWSTVSGGAANVLASYAWTNTHTFSNTVTLNGPVVIANTVFCNSCFCCCGNIFVVDRKSVV